MTSSRDRCGRVAGAGGTVSEMVQRKKQRQRVRGSSVPGNVLFLFSTKRT